MPSIACEKKENVFIDGLWLYKDDLPSPDMVHQELFRWKQYWKKETGYPSTCAQALNIVLPIQTSIDGSKYLQQLHTFNRAAMKEERLTWLAFLYTQYKRKN